MKVDNYEDIQTKVDHESAKQSVTANQEIND